jgi:manganese/zinc/iron transport system permease protein
MVGALVNISCGLLGCFLVLRRLSLLGDAISHAILPGLALAFMVTGSRAVLPMFAGAMVVGVLTALLTETIHRTGKVPEDASMGVVFTSLFAVGVILISRTARQVDLDPSCVLYGEILTIVLDKVPFLWWDVPSVFVPLTVVMLIAVGFIVVLYKELKIVSFDAQLATAMGINAALVHYLLMALVAGATVASFEAVGSILVVAMLIVPGATAHLLTDRLSRMLMLAALHAVLSSFGGYLLASHPAINTSVAGMMTVVAGAQFALAVLLAPRYGLISKWLHRASLALRIVREDVLAMLYRWQELSQTRALSQRHVVASLGGGWLPSVAVWMLRRAGQLREVPDGLSLTPAGIERARGLVRSHRLWESYLAKHFNLPLDHLHAPAERMEHFIDERLRKELVEVAPDATVDPHGRRIPEPPSGEERVAT